jgi:hypothetical protein
VYVTVIPNATVNATRAAFGLAIDSLARASIRSTSYNNRKHA